MVHNTFVKCDVCNKITRIRLQVGWLEEHPIAVMCGNCGISLKGKVYIDQENIDLRYTFENAKEEYDVKEPDYAVECSGEFPTRKICVGKELEEEFITPFLRFQQKMISHEKFEQFGRSVSRLLETIKMWPKYKRILELDKAEDKTYLIQEIWKVFPKELLPCRNELEILRAVRMVEVRCFLETLRPDILEMKEFGPSILKLDFGQIRGLTEFLNVCDGYSLNELQEQVYKIIDEFTHVFPYLVPAISVLYCGQDSIDYEKEGTTASTYADVKQFYLDVYETLGNLLVIPVALDNIKFRNEKNAFFDNEEKVASLEEFIKLSKANKFHFCASKDIYVKTLDAKYNQKLRNAIGHNDVEYDIKTQKIVYIPDTKNRKKKLTEYLLRFELEAVKMFQAILVISEYLYRLREIELLNKGVIPLKVNLPGVNRRKIGRNEKCPCGSGLKYKYCHGKS